MANRVKPLLHKIVSTLQGAFAPCKLINNNILLAHQLCTFFKKNKAKSIYMAVNLDMENSYDRLEWNFIKVVLTKLGFHPKWISWVREYISTASFSILINYSLRGKNYAF